uniref:NADH-ubiquinone oxidoreductase chain 5 n=1 Tax=Lasiolabops cosmopolites TaxID=2813038 RepID=A0A8T9ZXU8_9HEMI|nr:NADH dehydrogenase subunit 5 [Lasiolabops cosmopolites]
MFIMNYMSSLFLFLSGGFTFISGIYFLGTNLSVYLDWEILTLNGGCVCLTLILDYMSLIFMGCVLLISSMVVFYVDSYMSGDKHKLRFLVLVLLFIFSMMMMILSPNLISILLGWDGLGLVSYCLVIYFQNTKSYNSGMLTILTNRIGDVSILISISWMLNFGSWNFMYYFYFFDDFMYYIFLLLVLASFTKSAQIPFSSWLPAAMAAPTPVSALVHSSTLVTAGVYLLIRFYPLLDIFDSTFFLMISMMTMFMSGLGANFEFDLKKIIALSTLSQLGLMMSILFVGFPKLAFFHLLTHAFFKALLFLCAGLVIHVMNDSQDIRDMGYMLKMMPYTSSCFIISSFSLAGLPFLSGFYSKDMIIEVLFMNKFNIFYYFIFLISVSLTMSYSFRLFNYLMFKGSGNYCFQNYSEDKIMMISMFILVNLSIFMGVLLMWLMFSTPFFFVSGLGVKILPLISVFLGWVMGLIISSYYISNTNMYLTGLCFFSGSMWYLPLFKTLLFYKSKLKLCNSYSVLLDSSWGEYFFSKSHISFISFLSKLNYYLESNKVKWFMVPFFFFFFFGC